MPERNAPGFPGPVAAMRDGRRRGIRDRLEVAGAVRACLATGLAAAIAACGPTVPTLHAPLEAATIGSDEALRVHMMNGDLYVFDRWVASRGHVLGSGRWYDPDRAVEKPGDFDVPLSEVAVIETRGAEVPTVGLAVMGIVSGASLFGTVACLANPKACFGSCPTFYVDGPHGAAIQAEGFSASAARILEDDDIDALPDAAPVDGVVTLEMRNEAVESHAIRSLELVWAEGPAGARIAATPEGRFLALGQPRPPQACEGVPGDGVASVSERDGMEANWGPDPLDLAARAEAIFTFPPLGAKDAAFVLTARNTLMSTFVMYHLLALFGTEAGEFYARVERGEPGVLLGLWRFGRLLGGIEVAVLQADGSWVEIGTFDFTGPIARDELAFRFDADDPAAPVRVRLTFPRSHWRIDRAALATVAAEVEPQSARPTSVERGGRPDPAALASVRGEGDRLVTFPGDRYVIRFEVPAASEGSRGWFLRSRGYYYEWVREEWLADQDPAAAERFLDDPAAALRELAPAWIEMAPEADALFEASRVSGRRP